MFLNEDTAIEETVVPWMLGWILEAGRGTEMSRGCPNGTHWLLAADEHKIKPVSEERCNSVHVLVTYLFKQV